MKAFHTPIETSIFEFTDNESSEQLCFVKVTSPFDHLEISLKHMARMACLKSFSDDFLKNNLPKCLREYLGLS